MANRCVLPHLEAGCPHGEGLIVARHDSIVIVVVVAANPEVLIGHVLSHPHVERWNGVCLVGALPHKSDDSIC